MIFCQRIKHSFFVDFNDGFRFSYRSDDIISLFGSYHFFYSAHVLINALIDDVLQGKFVNDIRAVHITVLFRKTMMIFFVNNDLAFSQMISFRNKGANLTIDDQK